MAERSSISPRLQTGVPGLDALLGGGLMRGRSVLLKGPPGSGKTTLGLQILATGAAQGDEPGLLLTFEQQPEQLAADATAFGWDLKKLGEERRLRVMFVRPEDILEQPGRHENRLLGQVEDWTYEANAQRILIDSISHLRALYTGDQARSLLLDFLLKLN